MLRYKNPPRHCSLPTFFDTDLKSLFNLIGSPIMWAYITFSRSYIYLKAIFIFSNYSIWFIRYKIFASVHIDTKWHPDILPGGRVFLASLMYGSRLLPRNSRGRYNIWTCGRKTAFGKTLPEKIYSRSRFYFNSTPFQPANYIQLITLHKTKKQVSIDLFLLKP